MVLYNLWWYGIVEDVVLLKTQDGYPRGFGFVVMSSAAEEEAAAVEALAGTQFMGNTCDY